MVNDSNVKAPKGGTGSWLDHPQRRPLRRLILQIHLWTALIVGAYVIVISISGSAVVLRRELGRRYAPPTFVTVGEQRLAGDALEQIVLTDYAGYAITELIAPDNPRLPISVKLTRLDRSIERRYDPYTGRDLGDPFPPVLRVQSWLVDLHDNLLAGIAGRRINGIGGAAFLLLVLTGAVLWWPGRGRWLRSMTISWRATGIPFIWRLHSALGFWSFALLFVWGVTAVYFAFPTPFEATIDALDSNPDDFERPGERLLLAFVAAHFGRFGGLEVRVTWILLGLVPVVLFVTGFLLWWKKRAART